jgi:hypothetical protein
MGKKNRAFKRLAASFEGPNKIIAIIGKTTPLSAPSFSYRYGG